MNPPAGVTHDFSHNYRGLQGTWIAVESVSLGLTTLVIVARIFTKKYWKDTLHIEDCASKVRLQNSRVQY